MLQTFRGAHDAGRFYSPEALIELASARVGTTPGEGEIAAAALERLCAALEAARAGQTLFGRVHARGIVIEALTKRLRLADLLRRHPEIGATALPDPLIIVAPFRSGTTALHRLLAQDPDNRTPRLWEVAYAPPADPVPRGDARPGTDDPRIAVAEAALRGLHRLSPALARLHPMGPHLAEECLGLLETSLLSHSFMFYAEVPSYLDWLDGRDAAEWRSAYEIYHLQLQLLHWTRPGTRWVLKSPVHLWNLGILLDLFPRAHVVQLHRDPPAVMGSFCRLLAAYRGALSRAADPAAIGRQASSYMRAALERGVAARRALDASRFIDIRFDDLVAEPLSVARSIYARIGAPMTDRVEARMGRWCEGSRRTHPGGGPDLGAFDLDAEAIRMDFAGYEALAGG